jgi:type II secretion system protein J
MTTFAPKKAQGTKGFSLVEILVSIAIFSLVVVVATGALISLMDANRKAQSLKSVMNNLNFALENMSRSIRLGTQFQCGGERNCPEGGGDFSFTDSKGNVVSYSFGTDENGIGRLYRQDSDDVEWVPVTAPEAKIENMRFYVTGAGSETPSRQPRVLLVLQGYAGTKEKSRTYFNVQTGITQRLYDY